jgi:hypothetical protein
MVGSGEILRDEQIYLAHKCANPEKYAPPAETLTEEGAARLKKYKPTDVQLQVWDDLCHVAPTLSFTRPAKYMYRSVAQFGAWALARAQRRGIDIMDDDEISVISSDSTTEAEDDTPSQKPAPTPGNVGKAGDPLPRFRNHMIRQRVTRHGVTHPLAPESEIPGCCVAPETIGKIKEGPVRKWLGVKRQWDSRFASAKAKVHKRAISDMVVGYQPAAPGENPPPTALAGRIRKDEDFSERRSKRKSLGLAIWSLWGSKHDEETVLREERAEEEQKGHNKSEEPEKSEKDTTNRGRDGEDTSPFPEAEQPVRPPSVSQDNRSRSRRRTVVDEHQTESGAIDEDTPVNQLLQLRKEKESQGLAADYQKRPSMGGIAMPFSLHKEADTASMMTLNSGTGPVPGSRPMSPDTMRESMQSTRDPNAVADDSKPAEQGTTLENKANLENGQTKASGPVE